MSIKRADDLDVPCATAGAGSLTVASSDRRDVFETVFAICRSWWAIAGEWHDRMPGCRAQAIDTARIPIESLAAELRMPEFRYSRFLDCARVIESSARFGLKPLCRSGATNPGRTAPPNEGPVLQPARANRKAQDQGDEAMNDAAVPARMQGIGAPASLALMNRVSELRQQGIHVFDFRERGDTPASAKDAAIEMLRSTDAASYTDVRGLAELREAVAGQASAGEPRPGRPGNGNHGVCGRNGRAVLDSARADGRRGRSAHFQSVLAWPRAHGADRARHAGPLSARPHQRLRLRHRGDARAG